MKTIIFVLLALSSSSFAGVNGLYYAEGPDAGKLVKTSGFIGYYATCFNGNAYAVKNALWKMIDADIEKANAFVRVDTKKDTIIAGYVDTKCTDEGESDADCRTIVTIQRCR